MLARHAHEPQRALVTPALDGGLTRQCEHPIARDLLEHRVERRADHACAVEPEDESVTFAEDVVDRDRLPGAQLESARMCGKSLEIETSNLAPGEARVEAIAVRLFQSQVECDDAAGRWNRMPLGTQQELGERPRILVIRGGDDGPAGIGWHRALFYRPHVARPDHPRGG